MPVNRNQGNKVSLTCGTAFYILIPGESRFLSITINWIIEKMLTER
jgi:hypothetical protein